MGDDGRTASGGNPTDKPMYLWGRSALSRKYHIYKLMPGAEMADALCRRHGFYAPDGPAVDPATLGQSKEDCAECCRRYPAEVAR